MIIKALKRENRLECIGQSIRVRIESFDDYAISVISILTVAHFGQVVERHPDTLRERLWRTGVEAHSMLYCGGEVSMACFNYSQ